MMASLCSVHAGQLADRRRSSRFTSQSTRCAATLACPTALGIRFNLPYRVSFGQSVSIVGSSELLGNWDVERRIPMEWSAGDVWQAEVQASQDLEAIEYKYVVVERDGHISCWKPGDNNRLTLQEVDADAIAVRDAWDGSIHEVLLHRSDPAPSSASPEVQTTQEPSSAISTEDDHVVGLALKRTFSELDSTLNYSLQLVDEAADPSDPRLLMNDQKLAAVTRRAISLSKALKAGAPPPAYILRNIEKEKSQSRDDQ